jgi:hypothetical protein
VKEVEYTEVRSSSTQEGNCQVEAVSGGVTGSSETGVLV